MAGKGAIFISYRRDDTADAAGRVYDRLVEAFGKGSVFFDVDSLEYGQDFGAHIVSTLADCRVALILMGPGWLNAKGPDGAERLKDPADWVRVEVEKSLNSPGVQVIPVLMNGAQMPSARDLPESMQALVALNAAEVRRSRDFHTDMDRLIASLSTGAMTGTVVVEAAPQTPAAIAWAKLKDSDDVADLMRFAETFVQTNEGLEARRRADMLKANAAAWDALDWNNISSVQSFLRDWPNHPGVSQAEARLKELEQAREQARDNAAKADAAREATEYLNRIEKEMADHAAEVEFQRRQKDEANRRRIFLILGAGAVLAAGAGGGFYVWNQGREAEALVQAQLDVLDAQSEQLKALLPQRLAGFNFTGWGATSIGRAGAEANYRDPANDMRSLTVAIERWDYPDITQSFTTRAGSYGLPNGGSRHETYRGLPAVMFTTEARVSTAIYSVLVERNVEVKASASGSLADSIALVRRAMAGVNLQAIAEWAQAQPPPEKVDMMIASRLWNRKHEQQMREQWEAANAAKNAQ